MKEIDKKLIDTIHRYTHFGHRATGRLRQILPLFAYHALYRYRRFDSYRGGKPTAI